ncbi:unnamed protein product [Peronospora belbahrii]|uniref:Uncharacterized protein n=1 Tax=Peronospora belbahrii TaxID=622444 RepID=A0AAU9L8W2_9STRA|nr:unnamed protein product [Peronospora belbahrii]
MLKATVLPNSCSSRRVNCSKTKSAHTTVVYDNAAERRIARSDEGHRLGAGDAPAVSLIGGGQEGGAARAEASTNRIRKEAEKSAEGVDDADVGIVEIDNFVEAILSRTQHRKVPIGINSGAPFNWRACQLNQTL